MVVKVALELVAGVIVGVIVGLMLLGVVTVVANEQGSARYFGHFYKQRKLGGYFGHSSKI